MKPILITFAIAILLGELSCKNSNTTDNDGTDTDTIVTPPPVNTPAFNADTAYSYVVKQVGFGPRVPGTAAQKACAAWMEQKLRSFCDTVYRQSTTVVGGDTRTEGGYKKMLPCINLIGVIHPAAKRRILLLTHWDCRPWADEDVTDKDKPVDGADDAASGVGVLLELARALKGHSLPDNLGIDIFFTDAEDYGKTEWGDKSYCLGTQYWAKNPHVAGYNAESGILLDMVGARGARFPMEQSSTGYAQDVQQRVWAAAGRAGYSHFFPFSASITGVTDDHVFVNELIKIPTIDIIHLRDNVSNPFPAHWHTRNDNMQVIDKATLQAVGQTLLQVLFEAAAPA